MKRLLPAVVLLALSWDASAQAMQCGERLITQGDSMSKVAALCGNPTQIDHSSIVRAASGTFINGQWVTSGGAQIEIPVEVWLYNLGPDKFMRQLRFEEGRVVKIETLDYGYLEKS